MWVSYIEIVEKKNTTLFKFQDAVLPVSLLIMYGFYIISEKLKKGLSHCSSELKKWSLIKKPNMNTYFLVIIFARSDKVCFIIFFSATIPRGCGLTRFQCSFHLDSNVMLNDVVELVISYLCLFFSFYSPVSWIWQLLLNKTLISSLA